MAKKHKKHEEHVDESWLVPYADLLTLLLALFIVLFAMSSTDAGKFKQMAIAMNNEFKGGTGNLEFLSPVEPPKSENLTEKGKALEKEIKQLVDARAIDKKARENEQKKKAEMEDLKKMQEKIDNYIKDKNLSLSLKTSLTEEGLLITILDNALFDSGKADIKPSSLELAKEISLLLESNPPRQINVSGHTDTVPINTQQFRSNWDLSTARAVNFLQILLKMNPDLSAEKFGAIGYGEHRPVSSNNTVEGKAKNRRVEVLILPTFANSNVPQ